MTIDENYTERLANAVAKTLVEAFENLTIEDVNMYQIGYTKAIDDFAEKLHHKIISEIDDCADELDWIYEIAEQLKAGGVE